MARELYGRKDCHHAEAVGGAVCAALHRHGDFFLPPDDRSCGCVCLSAVPSDRERGTAECANGHEYYSAHGKPLSLPDASELRPTGDFLGWHNQNRFLG